MNQVNFTPQGNNVLVLPDAVESTTKAGIIIPDTAKRKAFVGTVVSIGEGIKEYPLTVKVGDKVVYGNRYVELNLQDTDYLLIPEHEIIGICE